MKIKTKLLYLAAFVVLAVPLVLMGSAGAVGTITYINPDGAYLNANGGYEILASNPTTDVGVCSDPLYTTVTACTNADADWTGTVYSARGACLVCHSASAASPRPPAHQKHSYLLTGHRNMLRKVSGSTNSNNIGGVNWASTNSVIPGGCSDTQYRTLETCTAGGATWHGFCSDVQYYNQYDCTSNGQTWSNANLGQPEGWEAFPNVTGAVSYKSVLSTDYYVYGGWYRNIKGAQIDRGTVVSQCSNPAYGTQFDCTSNSGTWNTTSSPPNWYRPEPSRITTATQSYSCAACHTTGAGMAGAPMPDNGLTGNTSDWYWEGVNCVRCHSGYTAGEAARLYDVGTGHHVEAHYEHSTNLCMQCHLQETTLPGETDFIEQYLLAVTGSAAPNNRASGTFASHGRSNQFLNSPHARFYATGTHDDIHHEDKIGRHENYNSMFAETAGVCSDIIYHNLTTCTTAGGTWSDQLRNRGCVGCHDVHVSSVDPDVIDPTSELSNIKKKCQECHTGGGDANATQVVVDDINHPTGVSVGGGHTPLDGDLGTAKGVQLACITCHMGPGTNHLFRIQLGGYTINSGSGGLEVAQMFTETGPNGDYTYAIAMDVGLACGQCHSSANAAAKTPGLGSFTNTQMTAAATGMHGGGSTNNSDCLSCHSSADTHHAVASTTVNCVTCHSHSNPPAAPTADAAGNATCLTCHSTAQGSSAAIQNVMGATDNHHGQIFGGETHAPCLDCHGATGGTPYSGGNALCLSCHQDYPTPGSLVPGVNHHNGTCTDCHKGIGGEAANVPTNGVTGPGVLPVVGDCTVCHSSLPTGHHVVAGSASEAVCNVCHVHPGVAPADATCAGCHSASGPGSDIVPGTNHHGLHRTCTDCHTQGGVAPDASSNAWCITCHTDSGPYAKHHAVAAVTTACNSCHTIPGVTVPEETNANCLACHSAAIGTAGAITPGTNHHGSGTQNCTVCHAAEPFTPLPDTTDATCSTTACHGAKTLTMAMPGNTCVNCHTDPGVAPTIATNPDSAMVAACLVCHASPASQGGGVVLINTQAAAYADNIHASTPTARFSWSNDTTTCTVVNFNAAGSTCPTGYSCTYTWDWTNDGTDDLTTSSPTTSHDYVAAGTYTAELTVTATGGGSNSTTRSVTAVTCNSAPTCGTNGVTYDTNNRKIVTFTQSGAVVEPTDILYINWGDGSPLSAVSPNTGTQHTYALARQYTLRYMVKDSGGLSCKGSVAVDTRASACTVTVDTNANLAGATVYVKTLGGSTRCFGLTDAAGNKVCSGLAPQQYKVYIYKTAQTFDGDAGTAGNQMPVTMTCDGAMNGVETAIDTVTFTH